MRKKKHDSTHHINGYGLWSKSIIMLKIWKHTYTTRFHRTKESTGLHLHDTQPPQIYRLQLIQSRARKSTPVYNGSDFVPNSFYTEIAHFNMLGSFSHIACIRVWKKACVLLFAVVISSCIPLKSRTIIRFISDMWRTWYLLAFHHIDTLPLGVGQTRPINL